MLAHPLLEGSRGFGVPDVESCTRFESQLPSLDTIAEQR